jgi:hypothetical protein
MDYKVKWTDTDDAGGDKLGWCDFSTLTIYVAEDQPRTALANTFLHEVIHAINYGMGISSADEENLTNRLANGLCATWRENPEAFKWWAALLRVRKKPTKKPPSAKRRKVTKRASVTRKPRRCR